MRGVNQGIGRVIRHGKDYGIVFLLSSKYVNNPLLADWAKKDKK